MQRPNHLLLRSALRVLLLSLFACGIAIRPAFAQGQPLQTASPNSRLVVDRFHVAKQFNDVVDDLRKKKHAEVQGELVEGRTEAFPFADVGVPPRPKGPEARGA